MPDNVLIATANDANGAHQKIVNEYLDTDGLPISVSVANPLPVAAVISTAGLATSTAQTTGNISLASIEAKLTNPLPISGTVNTGLSQPITDAQLRANPLPVSITGGGDATAANQVSQTAKLTSIDGKIPALGQALATASTPVVLTAAQLSALTPTPAISGFSTSAKQDLLLTELQLKAKLTETQPVSVSTLPLPVGAATSANQQTNALTDTELRANPIIVALSSDMQIGAVELKNATTDDRVSVINTTPTTEFGVVTRNIPSGIQTVSASSLPLPSGAAIAANQQTNAITNAEIRATALPVSLASTTITGSVAVTGVLTDTQLRATPLTVNANAGTNLNTSALALEAGNLATIKTNTDKIPVLGQALAVASLPVVLTAAQLSTITPPAAISGFSTSAKQDLLLTELQLKAKLTETQPVSLSSVPSHPVTNAGTFATQAVLAAETTKVIGTVNVAGTIPISGSVTSNIGTTNGLALDATLTGGTQKSVVRGGSKGTAVSADVTSTIVDANTQALDVSIKGTVSTGGLTDTQLRATALPISGSITSNIGTTNGLALDTSINTLLKPASTLAAVTSITNTVTIKADTIVNQANALKVDGSATTQPISGTVTANTGLAQPLTDTQIRATALPVSGTFFQATQPISGTVSTGGLTDSQIRATPLPISGTISNTGFNVTGNSLVSTVNSTAIALAANGVFTGTSEDVSEFSTVMITVFSDQDSAIDGLSIQQSSNGTNWDLSDAYSIPLNSGKIFSTGVQAKFLRIVYTNGATASTTLRLQTLYSKAAKKNSSVRPQDGRTNDNDFEEELSFLMGYNSLANAWNRVGVTNGSAGGNETLIDRLKVNASLRMLDTAQPVGSQLVGAVGTQALGLTVNTVDRPARLLGVLSAGTNKIGSVDNAPAVSLTTVTASALNADVIASTDVSAFKAVSLQLTGTWVGTIQFQGSNDNTTFSNINAVITNSSTSTVTQTANSNTPVLIYITSKFLRVRMTSFTSGSASGVAIAYSDDRATPVVTLPITSSTIGSVLQRGASTNGNTLSTVNSAASTNATLVKSTAGMVYTVNAMNASAALRYVRLYNSSTAPTVGTTIPVTVIAIPATSSKEVQFSIGMPFTVGIAYSITAGASATDATAVVAGDVQLAISWI